jgi:hypothetical protein
MALKSLWTMAIVFLLTSCGDGGGGGTGGNDTSNGVISSDSASLSFSGTTLLLQYISITYSAPPTQTILAGYPAGGVNPTCVGIGATCLLNLTLVSAIGEYPLIFSVEIRNTNSSHTSTLRFVATDLSNQANYGYIDIPVTYTP